MSETYTMPDTTCKSCGAKSSYSPTTRSLKCDYCGTTEEIAPPPPKSNLESVQAQMIAPVSVTEEEVVSSLHHYMVSGKYTPDDILERHTVLSIDRLYRPAFVFKGQFQANWTASFGYEREETYNVREKNDKGYMVWVTKTRKVTDWQPASGISRGEFCFVGYAGSHQTSETGLDLASLIEGCKAPLRPWNASYLASTNCEGFALSPKETYERRVVPHVQEDIRETVRNNAQGDYQKDWNWTAETSWNNTSLLLPLCRLTFEYDGKTYEFWVDGTNVQRFCGDTLPEDTGKKNAVYRSFIPVALYAACFSVVLYFVGFDATLASVSFAPWIMLAFAGGIGMLRRYVLLKHSRQYRHYAAFMARQESTILANPEKATPPRPLPAGINPAYDMISLPIAFLVIFGLGMGSVILNAVSTAIHSPPAEQEHTTPRRTPPAESAHQDAANDLSFVPRTEKPASAPLPQLATPHELPPSAPSFNKTANQSINDSVPSLPPPLPAPSVADTGIVSPQINALLMAAGQNDWSQVEQGIASIHAAASPLVHGDRHMARSENEAGLQLLRNGDLAQANQIFASAFSKDPADIEIANNLGYSFLKIGDYPNCIKILSILLMHNPVRSAAWINIAESEARLDNKDASLSALRLAIYFNHKRPQLQGHFQEWSQGDNQPTLWRQVLAEGMNEIDTIPESAQ